MTVMFVTGYLPSVKRLVFAWCLLIGSIIGWPVSSITWARHEPQTILALSWISPIITAINLLFTAEVRKRQDDGDDDPGGGSPGATPSG